MMQGNGFVWIVVSSVFLGGFTAPLSGQCIGERQKLTAFDGSGGDGFGWGVAHNQRWCLIGALRHDEFGQDAGALYLFERPEPTRWNQGRSWEPRGKLIPSQIDEFDYYGSQVALSDDVCAVSAYGLDSRGAVFVYRLSGNQWIEEAMLMPSDLEAFDAFGFSLSLSGDRLVVGNMSDDDACPLDPACNSGSAYVFRFDGQTWVQEAKLASPTPQQNALFGWHCDIDGDVIVVGATQDDGAVAGSGAAYVYRHNGVGWAFEQTLQSTISNSGDAFGHAVAIEDSWIAIGAQRADAVPGIDSGSVTMFRHDGISWNETQSLTASTTLAGDNFGFSIDLEGDMVITAIRSDEGAVDGGAAYHFSFDGTSWVEQQAFVPSDVASQELLGFRADLSQGIMLVTAPRDDSLGVDSGSVYEFVVRTEAAHEFYGTSTSYRGGFATMELNAEPVIGTTLDITIRHNPSSRGYGALYLGTEGLNFGRRLVGGSLTSVRFSPHPSGTSHVAIDIPDDPILCGLTFYAQVYVATADSSWGRRGWWWYRRYLWKTAWSRGLALLMGE